MRWCYKIEEMLIRIIQPVYSRLSFISKEARIIGNPLMRKLPFQDQIAIVTGASKSIGRATAVELARRGAHLCLASRDVTRMKETARQVQAYGR